MPHTKIIYRSVDDGVSVTQYVCTDMTHLLHLVENTLVPSARSVTLCGKGFPDTVEAMGVDDTELLIDFLPWKTEQCRGHTSVRYPHPPWVARSISIITLVENTTMLYSSTVSAYM